MFAYHSAGFVCKRFFFLFTSLVIVAIPTDRLPMESGGRRQSEQWLLISPSASGGDDWWDDCIHMVHDETVRDKASLAVRSAAWTSGSENAERRSESVAPLIVREIKVYQGIISLQI